MTRGGAPGGVLDIAVWAVPFGIVGGRLYHVATSWQPYFGRGGHPIQAPTAPSAIAPQMPSPPSQMANALSG